MPDTPYMAIQVGGHQADSPIFAALVDVADAEMVSAHRWSMSNGYATRCIQTGNKQLNVRMHRELLGLVAGDGIQVDHINGDTLDNRRANLRVATNAQNHQNYHTRPHRGASWHAASKRWRAHVELDGKQHHLGHYATREEAAAVAAAWRREHMPYSSDARTKPPKRPER